MNYITESMLVSAVRAQNEEFVTHDIVRFLYTNHQSEYLQELNKNAGAKYPFTETHRQLGQALANLTAVIRKLRKVQSGKTMRGKQTLVQKWRKA